MLDCLIALVIYCIVAVIVVYIIEVLLGVFLALPPQVFVLIRLLAALFVLLAVLSCFGLWTGFGGSHMRLLR